MKTDNFTSKKIALFVTVSLGTFLGAIALANPSFAQSVNPIDNRDRDGYQTNEQDNLGGSLGGDSSFNAFDLIHRANMNRGRNLGEFDEDTNNGIQNAAEEFKRQRNQQMQTQPSQTPVNSEVNN
jgi:hypothetical protein